MSPKTDSPPPIVEIFLFLWSAGALVLSSTSTALRTLYTSVSYIYHQSPHHILLQASLSVTRYILAPPIVLSLLAFDILILSPWRSSIYVLELLYPLYVLCGIASILGAMIGLVGRLVSETVADALAKQPSDWVQSAEAAETYQFETPPW